MSCKLLRIVCFSAALTLPQLAVAADSKAPDAAALGQFESIFDSCSAARPESAENYKKQRDKLTNGVAEKDLAKVRDSQQYKDAYEAVKQRTEQASSDQINAACKVVLGGK